MIIAEYVTVKREPDGAYIWQRVTATSIRSSRTFYPTLIAVITAARIIAECYRLPLVETEATQ